MTATDVLRELESLGSEQTRKTYRRHGVRDELFGVSYASFGKLQKRIRVNHALAGALWASGNHDARVLATMIADPAAMDGAELERWVRDLTSYSIADAFAGLAVRAPSVRACMADWMASDDEWVARAGWAVFARLAQSEAAPADSELEARLAEIERDIHTRPNRVRDAMNAALIGIGVAREPLRDRALAVAARIGPVAVDHGDTSCKTPDAADYIRKTVAQEARKPARPVVAGCAAALLALSLALTPAVSRAQAAPAPAPTAAADRAAVMGVVRALFDAMRAGDSAAVRAQFHPRAQLASAGMRQGAPVFRIDSLESFVRAVGTPHAEVWDEKIRNEVVHVDGPLAVVWVDYAFFAGTKFSHCGVDAFQLARTAGGWRIVALADTRKSEGCDEASWR